MDKVTQDKIENFEVMFEDLVGEIKSYIGWDRANRRERENENAERIAEAIREGFSSLVEQNARLIELWEVCISIQEESLKVVTESHELNKRMSEK